MSSEKREARIRELFDAARELETTERTAFLTREEEDAGIRREVEDLLEHASTSQPLLDDWSCELKRLEAAFVEASGPWPDPPPERIGRYRVRGLLGSGGMSTVFEGEREHPLTRVAIKVLRPWLVAELASHRFELEIDILTRLSHPNIARLLDAGSANLGHGPHPYLVLEHIEGRTLDDYVREVDLGRRTRLRLFLAICEGVAHAHAHGVIHRDLKPTNVLVDEHGAPRLVDFGIARLVGDEARATKLQTVLGQIVGTLGYMSPEQASGHPDQIDTRSDVFSLGAMLHELLTDRLPHDLEGLSLPEQVRCIREEDPPCLGSADRRLSGDLKTIVATALERDPSRRYQTVRELAQDVRCFLGHRPIAARPPSSVYLLRKYSRRHPALATGVSVGLVTLFIAVSGIWLGWGEARRQAEIASERLTEVEEARDLALRSSGVLRGALAMPQFERGGRDVLVRELLDDLEARIDEGFSEYPRMSGSLRFTLGQSFRKLGNDERALSLLTQAIVEMERDGKPYPPEWTDAQNCRGLTLASLGRAEEALGVYEAKRDEVVEHFGEQSEAVLRWRSVLAWHLIDVGRIDDAESELLELVADCRRVHGDDHDVTAVARAGLARLRLKQRRYQEAADLFEDLLCYWNERETPASLTDIGPCLDGLATARSQLGDIEGLLPVLRERLARIEAAYGPDSKSAQYQRNRIAHALQVAGRLEESVEILEECLAWTHGHLPEDHPDRGSLSMNLAITLTGLDRFEDADGYWQEARARIALRNPPNQLRILETDIAYGIFLSSANRGEEMLAHFEALYPRVVEHFAPEAGSRLTTARFLGEALLEAGRASEASDVLRYAFETNVALHGYGRMETTDAAGYLCRALRAQDRTEEVLALLTPWEEALRTPGVEHAKEFLVDCLWLKGQCLLDIGEQAAARSALLEARALYPEAVPRPNSEWMTAVDELIEQVENTTPD